MITYIKCILRTLKSISVILRKKIKELYKKTQKYTHSIIPVLYFYNLHRKYLIYWIHTLNMKMLVSTLCSKTHKHLEE